jgi:predicted transcriptional regulator
MLTKEMVLQSLAKMPAQFTVDELLEKIIFLSKIEAGLKDIDAGKVHKHEEILDLITRK